MRKGTFLRTSELKKKLREMNIGEKNPGWKGGKILRNCLICNKEIKVFPSQIKKRWCSKKCRGIAERGEGHPNWKGGNNGFRIHTPQWYIIRKQVYQRDNWICQICGKHCRRKEIQCHHIIPYRVSLDDTPENLITLCNSCHRKEEWRYYKRLKGQIEFNFVH